MAMNQDQIDLLLSKGIDIKSRVIFFGNMDSECHDEDGDSIKWSTIENVIRAIYIMEQDAPNKPIELHMSSPGGNAYDMLRLVDIIENSPCQFKFYGSGRIMSSATWIMAVCDERYLYRNTTILIHDSPCTGTVDSPIKITDRKIDQKEDDRLQNELNKIYTDNSRMPKEFWDALVKRDCYLTAEETVMLGLADKILEPKKRGNLRRMRTALLNKPVDKTELTKLVKKLWGRIEESKLPTKIEIHQANEKYDPCVYIDTSATEEQINQTQETSSLQKID